MAPPLLLVPTSDLDHSSERTPARQLETLSALRDCRALWLAEVEHEALSCSNQDANYRIEFANADQT